MSKQRPGDPIAMQEACEQQQMVMREAKAAISAWAARREYRPRRSAAVGASFGSDSHRTMGYPVSIQNPDVGDGGIASKGSVTERAPGTNPGMPRAEQRGAITFATAGTRETPGGLVMADYEDQGDSIDRTCSQCGEPVGHRHPDQVCEPCAATMGFEND